MVLIDLLNDFKKKYPSKVSFDPGLSNVGSDIPNILRGFYKFSNGGRFPFGCIFDIEQAKEKSKRAPFDPDWFFFGSDNYFTYWICRYSQEDGLWITTWDHESGNDIEQAVWENLEEFLAEMLQDYEENQ